MATDRRYSLVRPCANCPFRTDVPGYLRRARAQEIATSIAKGSPFGCHETTTHDDDGEYVPSKGERLCAGSMIMMLHEEAPNQELRIAMRTGGWDPGRMDMSAPVHRSFMQFVNHHGDDEREDGDDSSETCSVVDSGCLAPAGWMEGGVVVPNVDVEEGVVSACAGCGEPICDACADDSHGERLCPACKEYEDERAQRAVAADEEGG